MELNRLEELLLKGISLIPPKSEPTIFSIGAKGYYENPTSDILSFYLDPNQIHGFKDSILRSLFSCIEPVLPKSLSLLHAPLREAATETGKRLDIVIVADDWVLAIENKIQSNEGNPFDEYYQFLVNSYPNQKIYAILLSPFYGENILNWKRITYRQLVDSIRKLQQLNEESNINKKWAFFLREFLLHLEKEATEMEIEESQVRFVEDNYTKMKKLDELKMSYHEFLLKEGQRKISEALGNAKTWTKTESWDLGPALRFYVESWPSQSNVVIVIDASADVLAFWISLYAHIENNSIKTFQNSFATNLEYWTESKGTWSCWKTRNSFNCHTDVLENLSRLAIAFGSFLAKFPPT